MPVSLRCTPASVPTATIDREVNDLRLCACPGGDAAGC